MNEVHLDFPTEQRGFRPGEAIEGVVSWTMEKPMHAVEVRLLWYTTGKGDRDVGVADEIRIEDPAASDSHVFSFVAPDGPLSFDGKLVSLTWAIDAIVDVKGLRFDAVDRVDIAIGPDAAPVPVARYHAPNPDNR